MKNIIIFIVLFAGFFYLLNSGLKQEEKMECIVWQQQARELKGFYYTEWQVKQCRAVGVSIEDIVVQR